MVSRERRKMGENSCVDCGFVVGDKKGKGLRKAREGRTGT
jgi:hypothetical protein